MEKKSITQQNNFGCGLACIAFATDKTYKEIIKIDYNEQQACNKGFTCKELIILLKKCELNYTYNYLKPHLKKKIYENYTIVFISRTKRYPYGHYLIRYKDCWMDPWINLPKNKNVEFAESGFRKRLPGKAIYTLFKSKC